MRTPEAGIAVVTGASSGIGAATARRLSAEGYQVVAAARRIERLEKLVAEIGGTAVQCDVTSDADVSALAETVAGLAGPVRVLINNAGAAYGRDPAESANLDDWRRMYELNVLGTLRVTQALLPGLEAAEGTIVVVTSIAGHRVYPGGGGYNASKFAEVALAQVLREEMFGRPIRVIEIAPGSLETEFSLVRMSGDEAEAAKVYAGMPGPLSADDVADAIAWTVTRPDHVNIDRLVIKPRAQVSAARVYREPTS